MQTIVKRIFVGANSIAGTIASHFKYRIPEGVFGWNSNEPKNFEWVFIVPEEDIQAAHNQCKDIQLRNFMIISDKGMIIGG